LKSQRRAAIHRSAQPTPRRIASSPRRTNNRSAIHRACAVAATLAVVLVGLPITVALATAPVSGGTYRGTLTTHNLYLGHRVTFKVSANGKKVTSLNFHHPFIVHCFAGAQQPTDHVTASNVAIHNGRFRAQKGKINNHEKSGSSTEIVIKGRFLSGRRAKGTITISMATVRGPGLPLIRCSDSATWAAHA
jgi:hypothetical protein